MELSQNESALLALREIYKFPNLTIPEALVQYPDGIKIYKAGFADGAKSVIKVMPEPTQPKSSPEPLANDYIKKLLAANHAFITLSHEVWNHIPRLSAEFLNNLVESIETFTNDSHYTIKLIELIYGVEVLEIHSDKTQIGRRFRCMYELYLTQIK